jgi:hypothetical protein
VACLARRERSRVRPATSHQPTRRGSWERRHGVKRSDHAYRRPPDDLTAPSPATLRTRLCATRRPPPGQKEARHPRVGGFTGHRLFDRAAYRDLRRCRFAEGSHTRHPTHVPRCQHAAGRPARRRQCRGNARSSGQHTVGRQERELPGSSVYRRLGFRLCGLDVGLSVGGLWSHQRPTSGGQPGDGPARDA